MECMNKCGKELSGRQAKFCSDRCRMQSTRTDKANKPTRTLKPEQYGKSAAVEHAEELRAARSLPANFGQPDCECMHCQTNRVNGNKHIINHDGYKPANQMGKGELNRVSLPGDVDYQGVCA